MAEKNSDKKDDKENLHSGHRKRLRAKLTNMDTDMIEPHELLEFMLFSVIPRGNTNELAHRLLNKFDGSLSRVLDAPIDELVKIKGVGMQTALFLHTMPILFNIYTKMSNEPKFRLTTQNLSEYCFSAVSAEEDECFIIVLLNASNEIMNDIHTRRECLSDDSLVNIRAVLERILPYTPASILFVHKCNYDDKVICRNIIKNFKTISTSMRAINIPLIDYMVVNDDDIISIREQENQ